MKHYVTKVEQKIHSNHYNFSFENKVYNGFLSHIFDIEFITTAVFEIKCNLETLTVKSFKVFPFLCLQNTLKRAI